MRPGTAGLDSGGINQTACCEEAVLTFTNKPCVCCVLLHVSICSALTQRPGPPPSRPPPRLTPSPDQRGGGPLDNDEDDDDDATDAGTVTDAAEVRTNSELLVFRLNYGLFLSTSSVPSFLSDP